MTFGQLQGQMTEFSYDSRNRLLQAGNTHYHYDAENQRIGVDQVEYVVNSQPTLSQVLVRTENGQSTLYVYALGLIGAETEGRYHSYHFDYRGSTVALTDEQAQVVQRFAYGPYGELLSGDATLTPFLFNGMFGVMSEANGLYFMRARFYSAQVKRFVNQDPLVGTIVQGQTLNRFAFVTGNPVNYLDPFGLAQKELNRAIDIVKIFLPWIYNNQANPEFGELSPSIFAYLRESHPFNPGYTLPSGKIVINSYYAGAFPFRIGSVPPALTQMKFENLLIAVIHEYHHSIDYQKYGRFTYNLFIIPFTLRHERIYKFSEQVATMLKEYMYMSNDQWECLKQDSKKIEEIQFKSLELLVKIIFGYSNLPVDEFGNP